MQRDGKATGSRATRSGKGGDPMREDFPGYPHHPSRTSQGRTIHNGSAGAFDATEHSHDEEDEDQDSDDFAIDR